MLTFEKTAMSTFDLMEEAQSPSAFDLDNLDLWLYRGRTIALLRRYGHMSVEVGRVPSLLGREFFRSRLTSYPVKNFEDVVVFVTDMERSIAKLSVFDRKLLAMNVLEEYTSAEMSQLLNSSRRTIERLVQRAIDGLTYTLLDDGLLDQLPEIK